MKLAIFLFVGVLSLGGQSKAQEVTNALQPFTSDGCSWSPDGTTENSNAFVMCCVSHDLAYWKGGTREQREAADRQLQRCVHDKSGKLTAYIYYQSVKYFGTNKLPTPFHWGYGWAQNRGYEPLSRAEKRLVRKQYRQINWLEILSPLFTPET